jgi:hypothetical protein
MKVSLEHPHCPHSQPLCECVECWTDSSRCQYTIELCDHFVPDYIQCNFCEDATEPNFTQPAIDIIEPMDIDEPDNNQTMDMDGSITRQEHVANDNNSQRNSDMDTSTSVCASINNAISSYSDTGINTYCNSGRYSGLHTHIHLLARTPEGFTIPCSTVDDKQDNNVCINNEYFVPNDTQTHTGGNSTGNQFRGFYTPTAMDTTSNGESSMPELHNNDDRRSDYNPPNKPSINTNIPSLTRTESTLELPGPSCTNTRVYGTSESETSRSDSEKNSSDVEIPISRRAFHTFIIHVSNIRGNWRTIIARATRICPAFLIFNHGDHLHILYSTLSGGGNPIRTRERIARFLSFSDAGNTEMVVTACVKVYKTHCVGNTTRAELRPIYNLFRQLPATQDPNAVITNSRCETYFEQKKQQQRARIGTAKLKHLADILIQQINEYGILSAQQWENKTSPDIKLQLIREYGLSVHGYIQRLIRITKKKRVLDIKTKTLTQLLIDEILTVFPQIDQPFLQNVEWLRNLFQANEIDIIEFLAWNEIIKTKRYTKIDGLCLQGRTNAGKSLIIDTLIRVCIPEEIPRERDNSGFHLDQLPSAATALFEEPLITPITVCTWKLLLEGKVIKTDIKHKDKEGIPRIPIWITTAIPIDSHVDKNESIQLQQRVKTFLFKYGIQHRTDTLDVANGQHEDLLPRAPQQITTSHFAFIWLQEYHNIIIDFIHRLDTHNVLDRQRIEIPQTLHTTVQECLDQLIPPQPATP